LNEIKKIKRDIGNAESTAQATELAKIRFYDDPDNLGRLSSTRRLTLVTYVTKGYGSHSGRRKPSDHDKNYACAREGFSLVLYGSNLSSTVGCRYTSIERALIKISSNKMSVFIGILLSDATLQKGRGDARLQFKQKYSQFEYFFN
jgi:hypothetical protein